MEHFSQADREIIRSRGITMKDIDRQLKNFARGFPYVNLVKPAVPNDGILVLSKEDVSNYVSLYDKQGGRYTVIKFVPASGAASRMFKDMFTFLETYQGSRKENEALLADNQSGSIGYCLQHLEKFAFYQDLKESLANEGIDIEEAVREQHFRTIISHIVGAEGLNYGNLPKGLLKFHHYPRGSRTAFEEHMVEAAIYARDAKGTAHLHFTLSPEHIPLFSELIENKKEYYKEMLHVSFNITYSVQSSSTDTLAADHDNKPFRDDQGQLVFRPGGHGALIDNLDKLPQDIIFIKNIDNIAPDKIKAVTYEYKKALGGLLISLKQQTDNYLDYLSGDVTGEGLEEVIAFCSRELMIVLPEDFSHYTSEQKKHKLYQLMNRPIRLCGMVKNEGEPGGGPFWVRNNNDEISLQIVESSQVNLKDELQSKVFAASTHFNPVDLVCFVKDHQGKKFPLKNYVDSSTGFISLKSKDGSELKAQELPGLWNGAMAGWISIFVEVPLLTFNPVKTLSDLLRENHQS